jgi:hypothetical protein
MGGGRVQHPHLGRRHRLGDARALLDRVRPVLGAQRRRSSCEHLLAYETEVSSTERPIVRFGTVRDVRLQGRLISFQFVENGRMSRSDFEESAARLGLTKWELNRTHWAVKDGDVPSDVYAKIAETPKRYDIVLSFAGEDRAYVESVAGHHTSSGVEVFYDRYEEATLWGKDLAEHLDVITRDVRGSA